MLRQTPGCTPVGGFRGRAARLATSGAARDGPERLNMNAQTDNSLSHRRTTRVQPRQDVGRRQNIAPPASSSVSVASFAAPPGDLRARNGLSAPPDAAMEATTAERPARWVSPTGRTVPGPRSAALFAFCAKTRTRPVQQHLTRNPSQKLTHRVRRAVRSQVVEVGCFRESKGSRGLNRRHFRRRTFFGAYASGPK